MSQKKIPDLLDLLNDTGPVKNSDPTPASTTKDCFSLYPQEKTYQSKPKINLSNSQTPFSLSQDLHDQPIIKNVSQPCYYIDESSIKDSKKKGKNVEIIDLEAKPEHVKPINFKKLSAEPLNFQNIMKFQGPKLIKKPQSLSGTNFIDRSSQKSVFSHSSALGMSNLKLLKKDNEALERLKVWKNKQFGSELPEKRQREDQQSEILTKKPKNKKSPQKDHEFLQFNAAEFVEKQKKIYKDKCEREETERKFREQALNDDQQINLNYKNSRYTLSTEEKAYNDKVKRRTEMLETRHFFDFLLKIDVRQQEKSFSVENVLPLTFENGEEYIDKFQKAFFDEAHSEIMSAILQGNMSDFCVIEGNWHSLQNGLGMISVKGRIGGTFDYYKKVQPEDLIMLIPYKDQDELRFANKIESWTYNGDIVLGFVEKVKFQGLYMIKILEKNIELFSQQPGAINNGSESKQWRVFIINSCTTMLREFKTIRLVEFLNLSQAILSPTSRPFPRAKTQSLDDFLSSIEHNYNSSQMDAIEKSCSLTSGIMLLQGPPGTGKTHTIKGILSGILNKHKDSTSILVCAPSNAAVDEIAKRVITDKLYSHDGKAKDNLNYLRIGNLKKTPTDIRDGKKPIRETPAEVEKITLIYKAQELMKDYIVNTKLVSLMETQESLEKSLQPKQNSNLNQNISSDDKNCFKFKEKIINKDTLAQKKHVESVLINSAHIIFTTLAGAGGKEMVLLKHDFDYVIVDEACQSVELSTLIPLQFNAKVLILIGDPNQLPATTFNLKSKKNKYSRSLFERLMLGGCRVNMLTIQYRMVDDICEFSSKAFYKNHLQSDDDSIVKSPSWIKSSGLWIFDLQTSQESQSNDETSIFNLNEIIFIRQIYRQLNYLHMKNLNIGIITPYKKQALMIKDYLTEFYKDDWKTDIEVNTVDGFQGREKDIIIFSSVRSEDSLGFLVDKRRMNVAITRAKFALWIVGAVKCLEKNRYWGMLVNHCKEKQRVVSCRGFKEARRFFGEERSVRKNTVRDISPYAKKLNLKTDVELDSQKVFKIKRLNKGNKVDDKDRKEGVVRVDV